MLAVGEGAVLSHRSAAVLWELCPRVDGPMHVTVAGRNARRRAGIRVHRVHDLHPADATRRDGIPVTSPARTLLDLAPRLTPRELARAVEQFERYPRHPGTAALRRATSTDPAFTRSEAERRLLELVRAARLPAPRTNVRVAGYEVDLLWARERLVVEVDGFAFHSTRAAFERDRRRDADLQAAGYRVLRVTWRRLAGEPEAVVATLARALAPTASAGAGP